MIVLFKTVFVQYVAVAIIANLWITPKNQGIKLSGYLGKWAIIGCMDMIIFCLVPYILVAALTLYIWHRG
jgi:hypothetical protein